MKPPKRSSLALEFTSDGYIFWSTEAGAAWWAFDPDGAKHIRPHWAEGFRPATDEEWEEGR